MATLLDIEIIDTESALDEKWKVYTKYLMRVTTAGGVIEVGRRYSDFAELNKRIQKLPLGKVDKKDLPRLTTKKLFGRNGPKLIQKRKRKLEAYLKLFVQLVAFLRDDALHPENSLALEYLESSAPRVQTSPPSMVSPATTKSVRDLPRGTTPPRPASQSVGSPMERQPLGLANDQKSPSQRHSSLPIEETPHSEAKSSPDTPSDSTPSSRRGSGVFTSPAEIKGDGYMKLPWDGSSTPEEPAVEVHVQQSRRSSTSMRRCAMCGKPLLDETASNSTQLFCSEVCQKYHAATAGKGFVTMVKPDGSVALKPVQSSPPTTSPIGVETKSKRRRSFLRRRSTVTEPSPGSLNQGREKSLSPSGRPSPSVDVEKRKAHAQSFFDAHKTRDRAVPVLQRLRLRTQTASPAPTPTQRNSGSLTPSTVSGKRSSRASVYLPDVSTETFTGIRKSGSLWKRGGWRGGRKNWKQRLFVLQDNCLYYYKKSCSVLLGVVALSNRRVGDMLDDLSPESDAQVTILPSDHDVRVGLPSNRYPFLFEVKTFDRALYLCAETRQLLYEWVAQIRKSVREYGERQAEFLTPSPSTSPTLLTSETSTAESPGGAAQKLAKLDLIREESGERITEEGATLSRDLSEAGRSPSERNSIAAGEGGSMRASSAASTDGSGEVTKDQDKAHSRRSTATALVPGSGSGAAGGGSTTGRGGAADMAMQFLNWEIKEAEVEVSERLGGGNYGEVFRGRLWGSDVAVKLLLADELTDEVLAALKDEVSILSSLRHPNVVLYMGACTTPPNVFIVTEWCERGSLHDYLYDMKRPLSSSMRIAMALEAARGMSYLHSRRHRIIHRDLKSHNLLLTKNFTVKVADFGLTVARGHNKKLLSEGKPQKPSDENATGSGSYYGVQGTPQWMAPEVLEGQRYNGKVDVYSFGVVLCEIFSRILPYSDRYKRFDFVDAVLEEGAMPTIPRWCDVLAAVESRDDEYEVELGGSPVVPENDGVEEEESAEEQEEEIRSDMRQLPDFSNGITSACRSWLLRLQQRESRFVSFILRRAVYSGALQDRMEEEAMKLQEAEGGSDVEEKSSEHEQKQGERVRVLEGRWWHKLGTHVPGSIMEWSPVLGECSGVLRLIIQTCLSRDPSARPNFEELVDLLHAVYQQPAPDVFLQLDVPRLRESLCYGQSDEQLLAVREIIQAAIQAIAAGGAIGHHSADITAVGDAERPMEGEEEGEEEQGNVQKLDPGLYSTLKSALPVRSGWTLPHLPFGQATSSDDTVAKIPLPVILKSSKELIAGLCAKLRCNDVLFRVWLGRTRLTKASGFLSLPLSVPMPDVGAGEAALGPWALLTEWAPRWSATQLAASNRRKLTGLAAKRKLREGKALAQEESQRMQEMVNVSCSCVMALNCLIQAHVLSRSSEELGKAGNVMAIRQDLLSLLGPHCCRMIPSLVHLLMASPFLMAEVAVVAGEEGEEALLSCPVTLPMEARVVKQVVSILRLMSQLDPFMKSLVEQESYGMLKSYKQFGVEPAQLAVISKRLGKLNISSQTQD